MNAIVVYESVYGNTRAVAEAIAEGLGEVPVLSVHEASPLKDTFDLLVVGGPTHMHGLATERSRHVAVDAAQKDGGGSHIDPHAADEPGLRAWLADLLPSAVHHAAAFDTRLDKSTWFTGTAARGIAKRLTRHGIDVVDTASFLVADSEGPLEAGERERARAWGAKLAQSLRPAEGMPVA
jgi:Flavodoxin domain